MVEVVGEGGVVEAENLATVTHIIRGESPEGFDAAVRAGLAVASKSLPNIIGLRVLDHGAVVKDQKVTVYRVKMQVISTL